VDGAPKCRATRVDGSPCTAERRTGREWCVFHDPDLAERRQEGRRRGARESNRNRKARTLPPDSPDAPLSGVPEVASMLAATINSVRRGEIDPRTANCIAALSNSLLRALQGADPDRQLVAEVMELRTRTADLSERLRRIGELFRGFHERRAAAGEPAQPFPDQFFFPAPAPPNGNGGQR
jgi:hypothetical protein